LKKKVAISACLIGQAVRYDGLSKYHQPIMNYLASAVDLIPFCPEVAIGMPVPRDKIQLYNDGSSIRVKQIDNQDIDYTDQLSFYARQFISQYSDLSAIILKSRSPSCGLMSTPIIKLGEDIQKDNEIKKGNGQFAYIISTEYPSIVLIEETKLTNKHECNDFLSILA